MDEDNKPDDKGGPWWSEVVKEVTTMGLGTLFMTEEAVRNYLKDKKLPKEAVTSLLENVKTKKEDLFDGMAKEFGRVLSKIDISKEVARFLETHNVKVEARLTFEPKGTEGAPERRPPSEKGEE